MRSAAAPSDLIIVAGHAPFHESVASVPDDPARDEAWVLQEFQRGEPPLYLEHIRHGAARLRENVDALLIFSGGFTRREAGARWSEAATYHAIARHFGWWAGAEEPGLAARVTEEDWSRDSFENLLFSLARFQQVTGAWPRHVTMISWAFKQARFDLHRTALRFPAARYRFDGFNAPHDLPAALAGEEKAVAEFTRNHYGSDGALARKRVERNPLERTHPFASGHDLDEFFAFINDPANAARAFPGALPWEGE